MNKITFIVLAVAALIGCEKTPEEKPYEPEMVVVDGGTFMMGSEDGNVDEKPVHSVTLSSFKIGKFEITQAQWTAVMGTTIEGIAQELGYATYGVGDNYPMYYISWNDVQLYLAKLNEMTGRNYRLPTEAEWEYAARGGNKSHGYVYSGCNTEEDFDNYAWCNVSTTHPVGIKLPNELGIYDMSGNVMEWCSDLYGDYTVDPQTNPQGAMTGDRRIGRGGSFMSGEPYNCRVTSRARGGSDYIRKYVGFRVVLPM